MKLFLLIVAFFISAAFSQNSTDPNTTQPNTTFVCPEITECGGCTATSGECTWCSSLQSCIQTSDVVSLGSCEEDNQYVDSCPDEFRSFYDQHKTVILVVSIGAGIVLLLAIIITVYCCCSKRIAKRRQRWIARQNQEMEERDATRHEHHQARKADNQLKYDAIRKKYNILDGTNSSASSIAS